MICCQLFFVSEEALVFICFPGSSRLSEPVGIEPGLYILTD
jgi:hypothetical protein